VKPVLKAKTEPRVQLVKKEIQGQKVLEDSRE
jgi:hypothetical protein